MDVHKGKVRRNFAEWIQFKPDMPVEGNEENKSRRHFIQQLIDVDLEQGLHGGRVHTRFPPEPNGYLHIGHAKAICVNFGLAEEYGGTVNLRFDDTNPVKEDVEYVDAIREDIAWLGFEWNGGEHFTSDYFEALYGYAVKLIEDGKAYVDEQSAEDIAAQKAPQPLPEWPVRFVIDRLRKTSACSRRCGRESTKRGSMVLRAKIDMAHANMHMRDPFMYRIKFAHHHRTGDSWCIYPMYDFAHGQSDSLERITHSLCSLEFENHRPLYDWYIENLEIFPSKQREFARLNLNYTIMSRRKLLRLVEEGVVDGWDDPRMPTLSGLRRRGYTPESIREFCDRVGVAKRNNVIDVGLLEFALRNHLNATAKRAMAVLRPIKMVVTNYPEGQTEWLPTDNNPEDASAGTRELPFGRELYIEADDFRVEGVNKKWFRLAPGRSVRLKSAYIVTYVDHVTDASGNVKEVHVEYHPTARVVPTRVASRRREPCTGWIATMRRTRKCASMIDCSRTRIPTATRIVILWNSEPRFIGGSIELQGGACAGQCRGWNAVAVHAPGLLHGR